MLTPIGAASYDVNDIAQVTEITAQCAVCRTYSGSTVYVEWGYRLPDPVPSVGETWILRRSDGGVWAFESKVGFGNYNVMRYAMILDARDCVGKERSMIDDIANIGLDEIYLVAASSGVALWDSEIAKEYGIAVYGDYLTQILDRLGYYEIPVTLVFDTDMFGASSPMNQVDFLGNVHPAISYSAAADACASLVNELYSLYATRVRGVCFNGFGMYNGCDYNPACINRYYQQYGKIMYSADLDTRREFYDKEYTRFHDTVRNSSGSWVVSCIVDEKIIDYTGDGLVGGGSILLSDDFARGWTSVGVPLSYRKRSDTSLSLRSLEYAIAYAKRFSLLSSPLFVLDLGGDYATEFNMLAKYDATTVVLSDYSKFRMMNDAEVLSLKSAMGKFRVKEKDNLQDVGLLVSSKSRDTLTLEQNKEWTAQVEDVAADMLDKLPHRLAVVFDDDFKDWNYELSAIVVPNASYIDFDSISDRIENERFVFCGQVDTRLFPLFEQQAGSDANYSGGTFLGKGTIDVEDGDYYTGRYSAPFPLFNSETMAEDGTGMRAPILLRYRSSLMAVGLESPVMTALVGDLTLYAIGQ